MLDKHVESERTSARSSAHVMSPAGGICNYAARSPVDISSSSKLAAMMRRGQARVGFMFIISDR